MGLEVEKVVGGGDGSHPLDDFALGQWGEGLPAVDFVGEDVAVQRRRVDALMVLKGLPGSAGPGCLAQEVDSPFLWTIWSTAT